MATNTTNYDFKKPDESDFYSVQDQNNNWDKADAALKGVDTPTFEDYSGSTTVPDAATAINNIRSNGKLFTILSNIKAAFKGACLIGQIVNNCVTNNAKLPLSAAQGKVLMDLYTVLNTKITDTSRAANTANAKIELNGPLKMIAYGSDKNKWAFQQQFPNGVILSLGISETEIFYDYYDGAKWVRKWTLRQS